MTTRKEIIEFGDFQTPGSLALEVCECIAKADINPRYIIEPTCGQGEFLVAASKVFLNSKLKGYEINPQYCLQAEQKCQVTTIKSENLEIHQADFFKKKWIDELPPDDERLLVLGNPPWVTNSVLASLDSENAPVKANFQAKSGMDAMTGSANFDISEWMLLQILDWFKKRSGAIAMLVKSAVARKVLMHAQEKKLLVSKAWIAKIDAKLHFNVSVDACLLFISVDQSIAPKEFSYKVFPNLELKAGQEVGLFQGMWVSDPQSLSQSSHLLRVSKCHEDSKWRSGIKHDAAAVCELTRQGEALLNGLQQEVHIESDYLYPMLKGSEVARGAIWSGRQLLVTQKSVGQNTELISILAPKTWAYLMRHAEIFDRRASSIYKNNPRFSIFGVGSYSFKPWRVAICSLYKKLGFIMVGPIDGKPVMFDDTVYYLAFDTEIQARVVLEQLRYPSIQNLLNAMIFWDDKRPIKTSILNRIDLHVDVEDGISKQIGLELA